MNVSAIDIFCGIGGLSYGLKMAGIPVVAGVDSDGTCEYPYSQNIQADFLLRMFPRSVVVIWRESTGSSRSHQILVVAPHASLSRPTPTSSSRSDGASAGVLSMNLRELSVKRIPILSRWRMFPIWQTRRSSRTSRPFFSAEAISCRTATYSVLTMASRRRGAGWSCLRLRRDPSPSFADHSPDSYMTLRQAIENSRP